MHVEYCFDFTCPYAYLGSRQIESVVAQAGATVTFQPVLLGGIFRAIGQEPGGLMDGMPAPKAAHNAQDLRRFAARLGVPLRFPPGHPNRSVRALRAALALPLEARVGFVHEMYAAYWQREQDISSEAVVSDVLDRVGVSATQKQTALAANDDPAMKDALRAATDNAVARGAFGVPAIFVQNGDRETLFFGQDRLDMVLRELTGQRPAERRAQQALPGSRLQFWYDFSSPFAYLASTQVEALAARTGVDIEWEPMLLGALFNNVGTANVPLLAMPAPRRDYMQKEILRWAAHWDVPLRFSPHFPLRTVQALRLVLVAGEQAPALSHTLFRQAWADGLDIADEEVLAQALEEHSLPRSLLDRTREPGVKQMLFENTARAQEHGVFGAPTFRVLRDNKCELFWGQDRLDLVEDALTGADL